MLYYSIQDFDLVPSLIISAERYLRKEDRYTKLEITFLKFAQKHMTVPYVPHYKEDFKEISDDLYNLCSTSEGEISLEYIDLAS